MDDSITPLEEAISLLFDKTIKITHRDDRYLAFEPLTNISEVGETEKIARENLKRAILEKRNYILKKKHKLSDFFVRGDSVNE
ncbi:MAG: hypothetical protein WC340_17870 [Kiritimatiellia bacterium]